MVHTRLMRLRWLAVLALVGLVPPALGGSICVSAVGRGVELGGCPCIGLPSPPGDAGFATLAHSDCGPCSDVAFTALRGARLPAPQAPILAVTYLLPIPAAGSSPGRAISTRALEPPPPERNRILRC